MDKRSYRRICRALYLIGIFLFIISEFCIIIGVLALANARLWSLPVIGISLAVMWFGDGLADAADRRLERFRKHS